MSVEEHCLPSQLSMQQSFVGLPLGGIEILLKTGLRLERPDPAEGVSLRSFS